MTRLPTHRFTPRTLFEMLCGAQAASAAAAAAAEAARRGGSSRSGNRPGPLIAVGMNFQTHQLYGAGAALRHAFYDDVLLGLRTRSNAENVDLLLLTERAERAAGKPSHFAEICASHGADGIVLVSFEPGDSELARLLELGIPCVAIDSHIVGASATFVTSDNVGGAVAAVRHLGETGHRRIAFVGGVSGTVASSDRRLGYQSALEELGMEFRDELVLETDWRAETAAREAGALLRMDDPPDAFFCVSDELAVGTMLAIEQARLRIPEDVAVVGYDDGDFAPIVAPSLSSVRQDSVGLGVASVEVLLNMLDKPGEPPPAIVLPVNMIVRESSLSRAPGSSDDAAVDPGGDIRLSVSDTFAMLSSDEPRRQAPSQTDGERHEQRAERPLFAVSLGTTPDQSFPRGFLHGVFLSLRARAHEYGVDLLVLPRLESPHDLPASSFVDRYRAHGAMGLVILSQPQSEREVVALAEAGFPCVAVGIDLLGDRVAVVLSDNVDGATRAVSHLASSGRKRIAFIGGRADTRATIDRRFGYQSELERLGLESREEYVATAGWLPELALLEMKRMLALPEPPDAVLCGSDLMAIGAMAAIEEEGLRIPEDVAVVGYDDIEYASMVDPALTTVRQNQDEIAAAVLKAMLRLLDRPADPPPVAVLPVELVVRDSAPSGRDR